MMFKRTFLLVFSLCVAISLVKSQGMGPTVPNGPEKDHLSILANKVLPSQPLEDHDSFELFFLNQYQFQGAELFPKKDHALTTVRKSPTVTKNVMNAPGEQKLFEMPHALSRQVPDWRYSLIDDVEE